MTILVGERRYTPEDLLSMRDGGRYELVDGRLVEKPVGTEADWVAARLSSALVTFTEAQRLGWAFGESSYQCFADDRQKVRRPDASFIRRGRLPGDRLPKGHCRIAPDLAVEVVSPKESFSEVVEKVGEYLSAGLQLVWAIDPNTRTAYVWRSDGSSARLDERGTLDGEEVLPGFRCLLADILPPVAPEPAPEALLA